MELNKVAFIPARSGSKRVPHKNIKPLKGHPLMAYSICSAIDSGIFDAVVCVTDDPKYAEIARYYGAEVPLLRPPEISGDTSPDIEWVEWILGVLSEAGREFDVFSILRPTNPFRTKDTIRRAWETFINEEGIHSLRAVEKCSQHPAKMWVIRHNRMLPLLPFGPEDRPWHSSQYASLPEIYVQNASLEIAWVHVVKRTKTIAGSVILPFITEGYEGFDVNKELDWLLAEYLVDKGLAELPQIKKEPWKNP